MNKQGNIPFFKEEVVVENGRLGGAENKISFLKIKGEERLKDVGFVLKEPNDVNYFKKLERTYSPATEKEKQAMKFLSEYFDSKDYFVSYQSDYQRMREILRELIPEANFVVGEPREGNKRGFYTFQKKIEGKTWADFSKKMPKEESKDFLMKRRNRLIDLIGGDRKILIEFGSPVDMGVDNLMVNTQGEFALIDPGPVSELKRHFSTLLALPKEMRNLLGEKWKQHLDNLEKYPSAIEMTPDEIETMNEQAGITSEEYERAKQEMGRKCEKLME